MKKINYIALLICILLSLIVFASDPNDSSYDITKDNDIINNFDYLLENRLDLLTPENINSIIDKLDVEQINNEKFLDILDQDQLNNPNVLKKLNKESFWKRKSDIKDIKKVSPDLFKEVLKENFPNIKDFKINSNDVRFTEDGKLVTSKITSQKLDLPGVIGFEVDKDGFLQLKFAKDSKETTINIKKGSLRLDNDNKFQFDADTSFSVKNADGMEINGLIFSGDIDVLDSKHFIINGKGGIGDAKRFQSYINPGDESLKISFAENPRKANSNEIVILENSNKIDANCKRCLINQLDIFRENERLPISTAEIYMRQILKSNIQNPDFGEIRSRLIEIKGTTPYIRIDTIGDKSQFSRININNFDSFGGFGLIDQNGKILVGDKLESLKRLDIRSRMKMLSNYKEQYNELDDKETNFDDWLIEKAKYRRALIFRLLENSNTINSLSDISFLDENQGTQVRAKIEKQKSYIKSIKNQLPDITSKSEALSFLSNSQNSIVANKLNDLLKDNAPASVLLNRHKELIYNQPDEISVLYKAYKKGYNEKSVNTKEINNAINAYNKLKKIPESDIVVGNVLNSMMYNNDIKYQGDVNSNLHVILPQKNNQIYASTVLRRSMDDFFSRIETIDNAKEELRPSLFNDNYVYEHYKNLESSKTEFTVYDINKNLGMLKALGETERNGQGKGEVVFKNTNDDSIVRLKVDETSPGVYNLKVEEVPEDIVAKYGNKYPDKRARQVIPTNELIADVFRESGMSESQVEYFSKLSPMQQAKSVAQMLSIGGSVPSDVLEKSKNVINTFDARKAYFADDLDIYIKGRNGLRKLLVLDKYQSKFYRTTTDEEQVNAIDQLEKSGADTVISNTVSIPYRLDSLAANSILGTNPQLFDSFVSESKNSGNVQKIKSEFTQFAKDKGISEDRIGSILDSLPIIMLSAEVRGKVPIEFRNDGKFSVDVFGKKQEFTYSELNAFIKFYEKKTKE